MAEEENEMLLSLEDIAASSNLCEYLEEEELNEIAETVVVGYEEDEDSRKDWKKKYNDGLELALQVHKEKTYPWQKASNVKFPLMTVGSLQFHARAYPALVPSEKIVTSKIVGPDPDGRKNRRGKRVETHMNYQLREEMEGWEEDMDRLLITLPITGTEFKKVYFDSDSGHNVSEHVFAKDLVVHYYAKSLKKAARITHILEMTENEIREKINEGIYCNIDFGVPSPREDDTTNTSDATQGTKPPKVDSDTPYVVLEQHAWYDFDGDGYKEPYIFTVIRDTKQILRIVARFEKEGIKKKHGKLWKIIPEHYFEDFRFIPSPDGGFYALGFMHLIGPINEATNTIINQLIDAGSLSNLQSGFVSKAFRNKGGNFKFEPGEWKPVNAVSGQDLKAGLFPLPVREPSAVLFQLLGFLVEAGQRVTSTTDIMVGENPGQNQKATTTLTVMENGMKVFTAIYKRIRKSMSREFKKLYDLNYDNFDEAEYLAIVDSLATPEDLPQIGMDYDEKNCDIIPSADPEADSKLIQRQKAEMLIQMIPLGLPRGAVIKRYLEAMDIEHIEEFNLDALNAPQPDPQVMLESQKLDVTKQNNDAKNQIAADKNDIEKASLRVEAAKVDAKTSTDNKKIMADVMIGTADIAQRHLEGDKQRAADIEAAKAAPAPK